MKIPFLDLKAQYNSIKEEIDVAIEGVLNNTSFINGNEVRLFESNFAKAINAKYCIGVGNGTDAIVIALKMMGVTSGDEVIVPANSFIATSEAVTAVGGTVVFVDNYHDTYNIDCEKLISKITEKTKVIIAVHLYGQPADMDKLLDISNKNNIFLLEDSAQGHLAEYKVDNKDYTRVGSIGDCATFSFYPGKNLGAYGDAGAITTNNDVLAEKMRMYANHGRVSKYTHEFEGINSRIDGLQAAILNVKLQYLEEWTNKRRKIALYYLTHLHTLSKIRLPVVHNKCKPVWHLFVIRVSNRDKLQKFLQKKGIDTGVHYPMALPFQPAYSHLNNSPEEFLTSKSQQNQLLSLPIYPELSQIQIDYIVSSIKDFYLT